MASSKAARTILLKRRPAEITNLNFSPEKHGEELEERVDLAINFIVKDADVAQVLDTKTNVLKLLWDGEKNLQFRELSSLVISLEAEGTFEIGVSDEHMLSFDNAKLKKVKVEPHIEHQARVTCSIRVDPTGNLEDLGEIRVTEDCIVAFSGEEAEKKGKNKDQQELEV